MATFSHQHHPSLLDSVFLPNNNTTFLSPFYPSNGQPLVETQVDAGVQYDSSCLEHSDDNETSVTKKQSTDSSSMDVKKRKKSFNSAQSKDAREGKGRKQRKCNVEVKKSNKKVVDDQEEAPLGYIHVRARRGQATDSHSLAERVRREKISERMKLLQGLVPGCDKVTGKALMLDEIINYVQSLQNQVEFLSMKLSSLNPMIYDFGVEPDAFMMRQERLNGLASPLPSVQQCSPTPFTTTSSSNQYSLIDPSFLHQQGQWLNPYTQDNYVSLLSDVDGQKQKFINQFGLTSNNNMYCFH